MTGMDECNHDHEAGAADEVRAQAEELAGVIVGKKIAAVEEGDFCLLLTLEGGLEVRLEGGGECCAFGNVEKVVRKLPTVDHVVTAVRTENEAHKWFIMCAAGDLLELDVD